MKKGRNRSQEPDLHLVSRELYLVKRIEVRRKNSEIDIKKRNVIVRKKSRSNLSL